MNRRTMVALVACALAASGAAFGANKAKQQAEVRKAGDSALSALYKDDVLN